MDNEVVVEVEEHVWQDVPKEVDGMSFMTFVMDDTPEEFAEYLEGLSEEDKEDALEVRCNVECNMWNERNAEVRRVSKEYDITTYAAACLIGMPDEELEDVYDLMMMNAEALRRNDDFDYLTDDPDDMEQLPDPDKAYDDWEQLPNEDGVFSLEDA